MSRNSTLESTWSNFKFWFNQRLLKVKNSIVKKGHFYKGLSKDSYNINKLMVKNMKW